MVDLLGIGLSPFRLLVEFAPKGSLDTILRSYKSAGRKLNPYTMQETVVQVSVKILLFCLHSLFICVVYFSDQCHYFGSS